MKADPSETHASEQEFDLVYYASLLQLLDRGGRRIDVDIRQTNRRALDAHPMAKHLRLIEGASIAEDTAAKVRELISPTDNVLVVLDSNHTHDHVLGEIELYPPLVRDGSYVVVFDAIIEFLEHTFENRPWSRGNHPCTAVKAFLQTNRRFEIDHAIHDRLQITVAPIGHLQCAAA